MPIPKFQITDPESCAPNPKSRIPNPEPRISNWVWAVPATENNVNRDIKNLNSLAVGPKEETNWNQIENEMERKTKSDL